MFRLRLEPNLPSQTNVTEVKDISKERLTVDEGFKRKVRDRKYEIVKAKLERSGLNPELVNTLLDHFSLVNSSMFTMTFPGVYDEFGERYMWEHIVPKAFPPAYLKLHSDGVIYIHKLPKSALIPYCNGNDIRRVLLKGLKSFNAVSRPPKHTLSATHMIANFLTLSQQYWTGAQGMSDLPSYMAPFVKKDGLSRKDVENILQSFIYTINLEWRTGNQPPFVNMSLSLLEAKETLLKRKVVIDGKETNERYEDYIDETVDVLKAYMKVVNEGMANGLPFTYPVNTILIHPGSPNWKLIENDSELFELFWGGYAFRTYFLNSRIVDPDSTFSFCCRFTASRTENGEITRTEAKGSFVIFDVTGSLSIATLNLLELAVRAKGDVDKFFELLDKTIDEVLYYLNKQHELYLALWDMDFYYVPKQYMTKTEFSQYFITLGYGGGAEASTYLLGETYDVWGFEGRGPEYNKINEIVELERKIVEFMVKKVKGHPAVKGKRVNIEEIPGETALAKLFKKTVSRHPEVKNVLPPGLEIMSNSIVPYWSEMDILSRAYYEGKVQKYFNGGVMLHLFLDEVPEPESVKRLVEKVMEYDVVYFSLTLPFWSCENGHHGVGLHTTCPICGAKTRMRVRIVGYYTDVENWNEYRKKELFYRTFYKV